MNRIREGFCYVPNPLNTKQQTKVPLDSHEVEVYCFLVKEPSSDDSKSI